MKRRLWVIALVVALVMSGCGTAVKPPAGPATELGQLFQIALPRLVVDIDSEGNPSIAGLGPGLLKLLGIDMSGFGVPKATVEQMTAANIQHVELTMAADGLHIFVNAKPMPVPAFTPDSLQRAIDLGAAFGVQQTGLLKQVVPLVQRLGLDLVLRFPSQPGAAEIPLPPDGAVAAFKTSPANEPASVVVKFEVKFDENGAPSVMGISGTDLETLGIGALPSLPPEQIRKLQENNIQHLELRNLPGGFYVFVNGEPLPSIVWDSSTLANLTEVYGQINADNPLLPVIQALMPYLDRGDIGILLHFPIAPGAEPIPAKMHE